MKFLATTIFISAVGLASADIPKPQITVGLSNTGLGKFSNGRLGGLEPGIKWQTEGSTPEFDWEAGVDLSLEDLNTVPYSYWAKIKRKVKGFVVSARGASDSSDLQTIDVDIRADGPSTSLQVTGTLAVDSSTPAASTYSVGKLNFRQTIGLPAGRITISPRYNVGSSKADVGVGFARGSTSISVDTATKKVTLAQMVGDKSLIIPSVSTSGKVDVSLQRSFDDFGTITTSIKPSESINIKWEEGPYVASLHAPIDGFSIDKIDVSIKRRVDL